MRKITLLTFAALATYGAGVAYAQADATESGLQTAITNAEAVLAKTGVGYPTANSTARTTLQNAINTAKAATDQTSATTTLEAAVTTYKSTTTDIQMPEDGKVYTITGVGTNGSNWYMNYTAGTGYSLVSATNATSNADYPTTAHLVCRKITDTTFEFFNKDGKSFIWRGANKGYNDNKGFMEYSDRAYNNYGVLTVAKMVSGGNVTVSSNADLFGYMTVKGQRFFVIKNDGTYDQADVAFYRTTGTPVSSALKIEEVKNNISAKFAFTILRAKDILTKKGVGYPAENNQVRTTLQSAITAAEAVTDTPTEENLTALETAISTYAAADVETLKEGKAYTITNVSKAGRHYYMYYNGNSNEDRYMVAGATNTAYPMTAKLICRATEDGKFALVDNGGRYFILKGSNNNGGENSNKGYMAEYNKENKPYIPLQVAKMNSSDSNVDAPQSDLIGYMTITGLRGDSTMGNFVITATGGYDQAIAPYYNGTYSSALLIEETTYPNTVTLNDAKGIEGIGKIATFSAPFRTVVPSGVKAHYISDANGTSATTVEIPEGQAIPANTGVLLTSDEATTAVMLPALDETDATITGNKLENSAGIEGGKAIDANTKAYILTSKNDKVAFYICSADDRTIGMNKSYLVLTDAAPAATLSLNFGTTTGISGTPTIENTADSAADQNAPVYDLTGRRVTNLQKGGIYIKGGKKFIVK